VVHLTKEERDSLTREESLGEAYALARRKLKRSPKYALLALVAAALTFALAIWTGSPANTLGDRVREWSSMGFQFAYGVVGILLAGFAIYTSVALSPLAPALAKAKNERSGESEIKTLGLHFVETFVPFLAFMALHFAISALGWPGGPAYKVSTWIGSDAPRLLAAAMMALVLGSLVYLASCLWVFVFNVYATFMMMARSNATLTMVSDATKPGEASAAAAAVAVGVNLVPAARKRVGDDVPKQRVHDEAKGDDDVSDEREQLSRQPSELQR
jgi:hypothetical protein